MPARPHLARAVARLVRFGRRNPEDVLELLEERRARPTRLEDLLPELADALRAAFDVGSAEWWIASESALERVASSPPGPPRTVPLEYPQARVLARTQLMSAEWISVWLPDLSENRGSDLTVVAPIVSGDDLVGLLALGKPGTGSPRSDDEVRRIVPELCARVATVVRNEQLASEVRASNLRLSSQAAALELSRARIVRAADEERRRIERNLHDGLQEQLVAVALGLRLARELQERDPARSSALLERLEDDLGAAMEELRAISQGIYPPALRTQGLEAVLRSAAGRALLPTRVAVELDRVPPEDIEATIYFCCLEAIHNACKYAGAEATIDVHVSADDYGMRFAVADSGAGFDPDSVTGTGLLNIEDRVGALGGIVRIISAPGTGTSVTGVIPIPAENATATVAEHDVLLPPPDRMPHPQTRADDEG
jgi:signal transduction histidine kinase